MPDELIFAHRLMLPARDLLFISVMELTLIALYFLELNRLRIVRYEHLTLCRAERKRNSLHDHS